MRPSGCAFSKTARTSPARRSSRLPISRPRRTRAASSAGYSAANTDPQAGPVPLADFERESNDLVDPLRPWFDLAPLDAAETVAFIEECISGIHQVRLQPLYGNFLAGSLAHE